MDFLEVFLAVACAHGLTAMMIAGWWRGRHARKFSDLDFWTVVFFFLPPVFVGLSAWSYL